MKINGKTHYLWRAVDHEGEGRESYATKTRARAAALKFMKCMMKGHGQPQTVVTDGLRSYGATMKEIGNADRHPPNTSLPPATSLFGQQAPSSVSPARLPRSERWW